MDLIMVYNQDKPTYTQGYIYDLGVINIFWLILVLKLLIVKGSRIYV